MRKAPILKTLRAEALRAFPPGYVVSEGHEWDPVEVIGIRGGGIKGIF